MREHVCVDILAEVPWLVVQTHEFCYLQASLSNVWSPLSPFGKGPAPWSINIGASEKSLVDDILTENPILNGNIRLCWSVWAIVNPLGVWAPPVFLDQTEIIDNSLVAVLEVIESGELKLNRLSSPTKSKANLTSLIEDKVIKDVGFELS